VDTFSPSLRITNLAPSTNYDFQIIGSNGFAQSAPTPVISFMTGPPTPKQSVASDISNVACKQSKSTLTTRTNIVCSWTKAPVAPLSIALRCKCSSLTRRPIHIRKTYNSTQASTLTSATFQINRDVATCNIYIKAIYGPAKGMKGHKHPGMMNHIVIIVQA
jgi:hypothetical protein